MTKQRQDLIDKFQQWLDTNPNKNLIASQCANIADDYANQLLLESESDNALSATKFVEWVLELLPPEYNIYDIKRRFTPQVKTPNENELLWIETQKHNIFNPKFYTTKEVYELWLVEKMK